MPQSKPSTQQDLTKFKIAVLLIRARTNRLEDIRPLASELLQKLADAKAGAALMSLAAGDYLLFFEAGYRIVSRLMAKPIRLSTSILVASLLFGCTSHRPMSWREGATQSHPWGYYTGVPETRWNPDGRSMTLLNELRYTDPQGLVWVAPAGSVVDGASVPRSLWSFMGGPFEGRYRNASVLHDVSYDQHDRPWQDCDRMFYNAMRCSGVGAIEAKTMYYALYRFGWHWKFSIKRAKPVKVGRKMVARAEPASPPAAPVARNEIEAARDWIRDAQPSVEQIEQRAQAESR